MNLLNYFAGLFFSILHLHYIETNMQNQSIAVLASSRTKSLNRVITCQDCCCLANQKACDIFYNLCRFGTFKDNNFIIIRDRNNGTSDFNYENYENFKDKLQTYKVKPSNTVLIIIKNKVYFHKKNYEKFTEEIQGNIDKIRKTLKTLPNEINFNITAVAGNIKDKINRRKQVKKENKRKPLIKNNFVTVLTIFTEYNKIIDTFNVSSSLITIYNKDNKELCEIKKPCKIKPKPITIRPTLVNSTYIFLPRSYKKLNTHDDLKLPIIISTIACSFLIVVITGVFIYKKCKKSNETVVDINLNQQRPIAINNHIYDEPTFTAKDADFFITDNKQKPYNNTGQNLVQSEEHIYTSCIYKSSDFKYPIDNSLTDNQLEQQHIYHVLEEPNNFYKEEIADNFSLENTSSSCEQIADNSSLENKSSSSEQIADNSSLENKSSSSEQIADNFSLENKSSSSEQIADNSSLENKSSSSEQIADNSSLENKSSSSEQIADNSSLENESFSCEQISRNYGKKGRKDVIIPVFDDLSK